MPAVWKYTKVIRKVGSQPQNPYDGTLVVESGVRDQYASTPYVDTGLANDTTYFYAAYAYTTQFVVSEGAFTSCHLFGFDSILENNTWEQIDQAGAIGLAPSLWEIGDEKNFTVSGEALTSVILDFDHDDASDGSGKVPMSFGLKELMAQTRSWKWLASNMANSYYGGSVGSGFPEYFNDTVIPNLPEGLQGVLKAVNKDYGKPGYPHVESTKMTLFTIKEVTGANKLSSGAIGDIDATGMGTQYPYFATSEHRIKKLANGTGAVSSWYLASNKTNNTYNRPIYVDEYDEYWESEIAARGVCFGFFV